MIPEEEYVDCLMRDMESQLVYVNGRTLTSIFIGGGTPSLLSAHAIFKILDFAEKKIGFSSDIEVTIEANPGSSEAQKFKELHAQFKVLFFRRRRLKPDYLLSLGMKCLSIPIQKIFLGKKSLAKKIVGQKIF